VICAGVEGRTSNALCGGLTGRRVAPADPIRRRSGRDRNDDMGRDGCPRALDLRGVDGRDHRRADASTIRHGRGRAGRRVAGWVAGAGALLLRGGPDRVRALPSGDRGWGRVPSDRAVQDPAPGRGPQQVRSARHRPSAQAVDGRRADPGRGPVGDGRGGPRSGPGARAGAGGPDALPASALEAAVAPRPGVGPLDVDQGAPRVAGSPDLCASEHRAGVHRQPRRLRRADHAPRGAGRAALGGGARSGVLADGPPAAGIPGDRHAARR
jgi:hypothetical protein